MNLHYSNDRDKSYGIAGMAVTLVAMDGAAYLSRIDLDADGPDAVVLDAAYAMSGNPRMSAKVVWQRTLADLRLYMSMILGNVVCRRYLLDHRRPSHDELDALRQALRADAGEHLGLDDDESDRLFDSCHNYAIKLYSHDGICRVARSFADTLAQRRQMPACDVAEVLSSLGLG